ncbi:MAG: hypothetical protein WBD55_12065 [Dehalococcoidia bacterium]
MQLTILPRRLIIAGAVTLALVLVAGGILTWRVTTGRSQQEPQLINLNPPKVLPDTAALVNGDPVSGQFVDIAIDQGMTADEALQSAIDQQLAIQAGARLGLTATTQEAITWLKELEADWKDLPPEYQAEKDALLAAQGWPPSKIYEDPLVIEQFGIPSVTISKLRKYATEQAGVGEHDLPGMNAAFDAFMAEERAKATIVDCRTEDCSAAATASE